MVTVINDYFVMNSIRLLITVLQTNIPHQTWLIQIEETDKPAWISWTANTTLFFSSCRYFQYNSMIFRQFFFLGERNVLNRLHIKDTPLSRCEANIYNNEEERKWTCSAKNIIFTPQSNITCFSLIPLILVLSSCYLKLHWQP